MATELQSLSDQELIHRVLQTERDLVSARFKHSMSQLENTASLRRMRRRIAALRTEARRRERDGGLSKGALLVQHAQTFGAAAPSEETPAEKGGFLSGIVDKLSSGD